MACRCCAQPLNGLILHAPQGVHAPTRPRQAWTLPHRLSPHDNPSKQDDHSAKLYGHVTAPQFKQVSSEL